MRPTQNRANDSGQARWNQPAQLSLYQLTCRCSSYVSSLCCAPLGFCGCYSAASRIIATVAARWVKEFTGVTQFWKDALASKSCAPMCGVICISPFSLLVKVSRERSSQQQNHGSGRIPLTSRPECTQHTIFMFLIVMQHALEVRKTFPCRLVRS